MDDRQAVREVGGFERLPEAELDAKLAVWKCEPPVTTARVMLQVDPARRWKTATLLSFLGRLEKRGFLSSEKLGREYRYTPLVDRDAYFAALSGDFFRRVHGNSLGSFLASVYGTGPIPEEALDDLTRWLESRD